MEKLQEYIEVALAVHFAASAICALTPTKKDDEILGKIYKVLEFVALNIGKAKQR
jgi:hypothetical protein|tara:strand:- start:1786 stop:1950 length:165 start_codon:yes stop_codon:yes gene_type:complete